MSDQVNNTNTVTGTNAILQELSEIKSNLAVNSSETKNIKDSIAEIKIDIREIKTNYINQEQHKVIVDMSVDHEGRLRSAEKSISKIMTYGSAFVIALGIIEFLVSKFLR